jgi:hypothetical protein
LHTAISVGLLAAFFGIIVSIHSDDVRTTTVLRSVAAGFSGWILTVILLSVAPAKALSRRLIFLALGLLLLIALNELSKLGLDVTAPKLQG